MQNFIRRSAGRELVLAGLLLGLAAFTLTLTGSTGAQGFSPAPTLVPPTLVPAEAAASIDALPAESGIAQILSRGVVRVGILYNEPPFGELNIRGVVSGFDADLARSIAETWGVTVEFVQVTRQTAVDLVAAGAVDLLIGAQVHDRTLGDRIEFSHAYYPGEIAILVREGDGATVLGHFADRQIGVVLGTRAQAAAEAWRAAAVSRADGAYDFNLQTFLTFDQAFGALVTGGIDGLVDQRVRLGRALRQPGIARFVNDPVQPEPLAIGLRRQDVNLRNLVNRTLQHLFRSGRLNEIHQAHFNGEPYYPGALILWLNLPEDAPHPDQFPTDVPFPPQYVVPRLQTERVLRVTGLAELPPDANESARRFDTVHRLLVNALAERWGVSVVYVPNSTLGGIDHVASGQADLAVGIQPDWNVVGQVDFTGYYLMHGLQLMVENSRGIDDFGDLRGRAIGFFTEDAGAREIFQAEAERSRAIIDDFYRVPRESDAAFAMLTDTAINLDAVFGDSMRLIPHLEANPDQLSIFSNQEGRAIWFTRTYRVMAVPRNDIDFRLLVEYTLQELAAEGTLQQIMTSVMRPQDAPRFERWPGSSHYLGYELGR